MEENQATSLGEFSPKVQEDVNGLLWLGSIQDSVEYAGHTFTLRTLKADEELFAARLTQDYQDTLAQGKAWAWAHVAQALVDVDGDEEFCPSIGPDRWGNARARFNFCVSRWYWITGQALFNEYLKLVQRQTAAVDAIRNLSEGSPPKSSTSGDSYNDQDDSTKGQEIMELVDEDSTSDSTSS